MPRWNSSPLCWSTSSQEELLFIFDSGRTVTHPVTQLPISSADNLDWEQAFFEEPRIREELAAIQPIAKMPLYEMCIQASRRGYVKKIKDGSLHFTPGRRLHRDRGESYQQTKPAD